VEWGQLTRSGMLCHGPTDPREELEVVFAVGDDDEDLPYWNYVLIDEDMWDEDEDDERRCRGARDAQHDEEG